VDRFASYDAAVTWLKSIGGYVAPVERRADARYSVAVIGPDGLTRASTFDTAYREAVRLACCKLQEAMRGVSEIESRGR
jgi:hypothetical protein